jgi:hypothetical protein
MGWPVPSVTIPGIIYFRQDLKPSALKLRDVLRTAQSVPENHVVFVDPKQLNSQKQELARVSQLDMVAVLGQQ